MLARMWNKGNTPPLFAGVQNCTTTMGINMEVPRKIKTLSTTRHSYTTTGHMPKGCSIYYKDTCSALFIVALFIMARNLKQPSVP